MPPRLTTDVVSRGNFTDRMAAHLADVKNADKAHRINRDEVDQKLEALTRMVCEQHEISFRLGADLRDRVTERFEGSDSDMLGALIDVLSGWLPSEDSGPFEADGPAGPDPTPRDVTGPTGEPPK